MYRRSRTNRSGQRACKSAFQARALLPSRRWRSPAPRAPQGRQQLSASSLIRFLPARPVCHDTSAVRLLDKQTWAVDGPDELPTGAVDRGRSGLVPGNVSIFGTGGVASREPRVGIVCSSSTSSSWRSRVRAAFCASSLLIGIWPSRAAVVQTGLRPTDLASWAQLIPFARLMAQIFSVNSLRVMATSIRAAHQKIQQMISNLVVPRVVEDGLAGAIARKRIAKHFGDPRPRAIAHQEDSISK